MNACSLPPDILSRIFAFCVPAHLGHIDQKEKLEGQSVLFACLQVNKTWYDTASPLLYRNSLIRDIGSFFHGLDGSAQHPSDRGEDSVSMSTCESREIHQTGNTKVALLQHVRRFQIIPLYVPKEYDRRDDENGIFKAEKASFEAANTLLRQSLSIHHLLPRLESITLNSHEVLRGEEEDDVVYAFDVGVREFKGLILPLVRSSLCQYYHPDGYGCTPKISATDIDISMEIDRDSLPETIETHTNLIEGVPQIIWGTTNIISVRSVLDSDQHYWPLWTSSKYHEEENDTFLEELQEFQGECRDVEWHHWYTDDPRRIVEEIVSSMKESRARCKDTLSPGLDRQASKSMRKLDENTKIHFYGLEKVLPCYSLTHGINLQIFSENRVVRERGQKEDISSWYAYSNSRFNTTILDMRGSDQQHEIEAMEMDMKIRLNTDDEGYWVRHHKLRKAPEVKCFLAVEYDGCSSCGDGKGNRWRVKQTRTPESMAPEIVVDEEYMKQNIYQGMMEFEFCGEEGYGFN